MMVLAVGISLLQILIKEREKGRSIQELNSSIDIHFKSGESTQLMPKRVK